jgi:hypothetical protein
LARPQTLGDAVDEQIDDGVFGKVTLAEVFVLGPQLLNLGDESGEPLNGPTTVSPLR